MIDPENSRRLKEMRCMMGLSQKEVYDSLEMNPGQYSEVEAGRLSAETAIAMLRKAWDVWKEKEIERLEARIKYIKAI